MDPARARAALRPPVAVVLLLTAACGGDPARPGAAAAGGPWFEEVAAEVGVRFEHVPYRGERRYHFPEIMLGGVGLFDYDGDGDLDLYLVQGGDLTGLAQAGDGNRLLRNRDGGSFDEVTEEAGVGHTGYGMGCACADHDNDGDIDLYVTNVGPNVLYRNEGDGTFSDVTEPAGVGDPGWGTSCAFTDLDSDGFLDLFVANYVDWSPETERVCRSLTGGRDYCQPTNYEAPARDTLYRNRGDGTFADATLEAGLDGAFGYGLGVAVGDFSGDGRTDLYVANDGTANQLWINQGGFRLRDEALSSGCALGGHGNAEAGMGVAAIDLEEDGDLDLFLSHLRNQTNTFYVNRGGLFRDRTASLGLAASSQPYTGFGLGFADFDHDGQLDLFLANGRVVIDRPVLNPQRPYGDPNLLYAGLADGRFVAVEPQGGTGEPLVETSRGAAFGDIDDDGDVDVVVANLQAPVHVLRNRVGSRGSWIRFRALQPWGSDALGATVQVTCGQRRLHRAVQPAYSYLSSNDPRVHFGLGSATGVDEVRVRWPDGTEESFGARQAGTTHELRKGSGR